MRHDPGHAEAVAWHDDLIYGLHLRAPDPAHNDWRSEIVLDIDHIVEWVRGADGRMRFRVAPASLVFHDTADLRIGLDFGGSACRRSLNELSIAAISKRPAEGGREAGPRPYFRWRIELNLPAGGELTFGASGYSLTLRAAPVLLDEQRLPAFGRPHLLCEDRSTTKSDAPPPMDVQER